MSLPLFTDEAIYTRWSQIARLDAAWRFISLTDGKQPMFVWWDMIFMHVIHDPLLAGRLVSTIAGFLTIIGLFFLGKEIFKNKWIGFLSAGLYVFYPFALVYDRMSLYDSMVALFAVWSLFLEIVLVRNPRAWVAFVLALVLGGGMLTKTSAFFSWYLLPATIVLFDWKSPEKGKRFLRWLGFAVIAVGLANVYYSILRLSPFFHIIGDKNETFVYSFYDWLQHPFTFFLGNLSGLWDWFSRYMTWPMMLLIVSSLFISLKYTKEKLVLFIYFGVPLVALALFGKVLYPRFIFFMTVMLLPLIALSLYEVLKRSKNLFIGSIIALLFAGMWLWSDYFIINNFAVAPIPLADLTQYSNDWPAGGGVREMVAYFTQVAATKKIYVLSQGTFGSLPTLGMEIYLDDNKNIEKRGLWPIPSEIPGDLLEKAKTMPVYVVFDQTDVPPNWPVTLQAQYRKGTGTAYLRIYQVRSSKPL